MEPLLTVQIPTFRNIQQLCATIATLMGYHDYPMQVRIINNDGTPEGEEEIDKIVARDTSDMLEVIHAKSNLGWMGAHNLALKTCTTPYVCLLNDDVFFLPGNPAFFRTLTHWFKDPDVGAVGPISNFAMGTQNMFNIDVPIIAQTTLLIGFCCAMRTQLIKDIGGLDESLPGGDDLDWSIRIRDAGYKLMLDKSLFVYHHGQQTGHKVHGAYWDSQQHQDRTNNALIRKHGVAKWYDCVKATYTRYGPPLEELFIETTWYEEHVKRHVGEKGMNLGCGHAPIEGVPGLDLARQGEKGAGGRRASGAILDVTGDATDLPIPDNTLDYLCAAHILEHTLDPLATLEEWSRVLKPGGSLYMSLPDQGKVNAMLLDSTHLHAYTTDSFRRLIEKAGWHVESCEQFPKSIGFGTVARNIKPPYSVEDGCIVMAPHCRDGKWLMKETA